MFHRRLTILWVLIVLAMLVIGGKLFYLQVMRGGKYRELAENNISYKEYLDTRRGCILDRCGVPLAVDETEYEVCVYLDRLKKLKDPSAWCEEMAKLVEMDPGELASQIDATGKRLEALAERGPDWRQKQDLLYLRRQPQPVLTRLEPEAVKRIDLGQDRLELYREGAHTYPVFTVRDVARRHYPMGPVAAHIIGYLGPVNSDEYNEQEYRYAFDGDTLKKFFPDDPIGRTGIEATYESQLRGARGMIFGIKDVHGLPLANMPSTRIEPILGKDIRLTIDVRLQRLAEEALDRQLNLLEASRHEEDPFLAGSVVILDPRTGDVLAAASHPRYDLNAVHWNYDDLLKDPHHALFHRAALGAYPLGSVFKIVVATAGLEEGILNGHTEFTCSGSFTLGDRVYRCTAAHGTVEMSRAIEQSCNVYFWNAGLAVGAPRLKDWAERYGLGRRTGADIAEAGGFVPLAKDRAGVLNVAIGQGRVLVTPLQAARMMGCFALDGTLADTRFCLDREVRARHVDLHPDRTGVIRWGMHDVVYGPRGTARNNGQVSGLVYAGKTGTAQTGHAELFDAWFAGFAPFKEPALSFACVVENTRGHGGTDATPVIRDIFSRMMADPELAKYFGGGDKE